MNFFTLRSTRAVSGKPHFISPHITITSVESSAVRGGEVDLSVHSQEGFLSKHEAPGVKVESGRGDTGSKPGKPGTGQPGAP